MAKLSVVYRSAWAAAAAWLFLIYATIPIGRPVLSYLEKKEAALPLMNAGCALALGAFFLLALVKKTPRSKRRKFLFLLSFAAYILALSQVAYPEERIHFFEYSILAYLYYRAVSARLTGLEACSAVLGLSFASGAFDEFLQHLHPDRYYSFQDILINLAGASFGLIFLGILAPHGKR